MKAPQLQPIGSTVRQRNARRAPRGTGGMLMPASAAASANSTASTPSNVKQGHTAAGLRMA
eukprot:3367107-Lingulodinium_polyedra.AAC.1